MARIFQGSSGCSWDLAGRNAENSPFVPDRNVAQLSFQKSAQRCERIKSESLHLYQHGNKNLQRKVKQISDLAVFVWFSGSSATNQQASIMFYSVSQKFQNGWYVSFAKMKSWQMNKTKNISKAEISALIGSV